MLKVVFRMLDKAGLTFVEPRREDGHGSSAVNPSHFSNPATTGTWGYKAGVSGTPAIPAGARILQISASAPLETPASVTINGGDSVPIPSGSGVGFEPVGNLVAPTIVFTGTESYMVEYLT